MRSGVAQIARGERQAEQLVVADPGDAGVLDALPLAGDLDRHEVDLERCIIIERRELDVADRDDLDRQLLAELARHGVDSPGSILPPGNSHNPS